MPSPMPENVKNVSYGAIPLEMDANTTNKDSISVLIMKSNSSLFQNLFKNRHTKHAWDIFFFNSTVHKILTLTFAVIGLGCIIYAFTSFGQPSNQIYDYIVVGSGPAGSVITSKLFHSGARVLLLEAGGHTQVDLGGKDSFGGPVSRYDIPLLWSSLMTDHTIHWNGYNIHGIVQGKGLGGSGLHTAMIYIRAIKEDIEKWNVKGWDWDTLLNQYISLEDYGNNDNGEPLPYYHGTGGPIRTTKAPFVDPIAPHFIAAAVHSGIKYSSDFNEPGNREGVGFYDFNIRDGTRDSAAARFLGPIMKSKNLNIETNAEVRRIILSPLPAKRQVDPGVDDDTYEAVAVEYVQNGIVKTASLSRSFRTSRTGIVLAAGALNSPKLLMNSGIGPVEVLNKAGIKVKVNSPRVGKNARDHGATQVLFRVNDAITSTYPIAYSIISKWGQYTDAVERAKRDENVKIKEFGVLGSSGLAAGAFLVSPYSTDGRPDIQLTLFPTDIFDHGPFSSIRPPRFDAYNISSRIDISSQNFMVIAVALMYSETYFEISLNETDPYKFNPHLQSSATGGAFHLEDIDLKILAWGVEKVREIAAMPPLAHIVTEVVSPALDITFDMLPEWVQQNHHPYAHWVGSAAMGATINDSVVDERTNVHSVKSLYVGDASVIPQLSNGNIHALVTAVASQAADLILLSDS